MEELGQVRVGGRPEGDVDDDRVDVLADLVVHRRVVDDLDVHLDADPGQLGLHRLVDDAVGRHLGGDDAEREAIRQTRLGQQLLAPCSGRTDSPGPWLDSSCSVRPPAMNASGTGEKTFWATLGAVQRQELVAIQRAGDGLADLRVVERRLGRR